MLRVSERTLTHGTATLRIEGRMIGPWVVEVHKCCEEFLAKGCRLILDLANVSFVDRDGIVLLQELMGRRVALVNCSPFLTEQLKEVST